MLDLKIAGIVFASLLIIATTLQGTPLTQEKPDINTDSSILDKIENFLSGPLPEPQNPVQIQITTPELNNYQQKITKAQIKTPELKQITIKGQKIQTKKPLTLENYTGTLQLNKQNTTLKGNAEKAYNQQITINNTQITQTIPNNQLQINKQQTTSFDLKQATGTIKTNQTQLDIQNDTLKIDSYTGNQTITPENNHLNLEGKVNQLNTEELTID